MAVLRRGRESLRTAQSGGRTTTIGVPAASLSRHWGASCLDDFRYGKSPSTAMSAVPATPTRGPCPPALLTDAS